MVSSLAVDRKGVAYTRYKPGDTNDTEHVNRELIPANYPTLNISDISSLRFLNLNFFFTCSLSSTDKKFPNSKYSIYNLFPIF